MTVTKTLIAIALIALASPVLAKSHKVPAPRAQAPVSTVVPAPVAQTSVYPWNLGDCNKSSFCGQ